MSNAFDKNLCDVKMGAVGMDFYCSDKTKQSICTHRSENAVIAKMHKGAFVCAFCRGDNCASPRAQESVLIEFCDALKDVIAKEKRRQNND